MTAIHDPEVFLETFNSGDTFWEIATYDTRPAGVNEYMYFGRAEAADEFEQSIYLIWVYDGIRNKTYKRSLVDSCTQEHGIFATRDEAEAELARRIEEFKNDPVLQERYEFSRMMGQAMVESVEQSADGSY